MWHANDVPIASHENGMNDKLISRNKSNIGYVSMILSVRRNKETCIDSVLIISQTESNYKPRVICTTENNNSRCLVSYNSSMEYRPVFKSSGCTQMEQLLDQNDIVYPNNSCATQILVCQSIDTVQMWTRDNMPVATFNEVDLPGKHNATIHPSISSVVQSLTAVLETSENNIISVIIWTDFDSVGSFNVSCSSTMDKTTLLVNQPTFTTADNSDAIRNLISTQSCSTQHTSSQAYSTQQFFDSNNTSTFAGRSVSLSPSKLIYIISCNYCIQVFCEKTNCHNTTH